MTSFLAWRISRYIVKSLQMYFLEAHSKGSICVGWISNATLFIGVNRSAWAKTLRFQFSILTFSQFHCIQSIPLTCFLSSSVLSRSTKILYHDPFVKLRKHHNWQVVALRHCFHLHVPVTTYYRYSHPTAYRKIGGIRPNLPLHKFLKQCISRASIGTFARPYHDHDRSFFCRRWEQIQALPYHILSWSRWCCPEPKTHSQILKRYL